MEELAAAFVFPNLNFSTETIDQGATYQRILGKFAARFKRPLRANPAPRRWRPARMDDYSAIIPARIDKAGW
jgi:hypothetical protein